MAASNAVGKLREIVEAHGDTRELLLQAVGSVEHERVLHGQILAAVYPGSQYHAGTKILRTDKSLQESQYQGTVFLVLKLGPSAFDDEPKLGIAHKDRAKVGDWILARPSDGMQLFIREVPCRLFEDSNVKMIVSDPTMYW
jgi:hypothetical protein